MTEPSKGPSKGPSVFEEPHLRKNGELKLDPSEASAARELAKPSAGRDIEEERIEHGVWEEPALSAELAGKPPRGASYGEWIMKRREGVGALRSWSVTLAAAALAGPWAVIGAFYGSGKTAFSILAIVVFGPVVEETMKVAAATLIVEKRPWLFTSALQIVVAALAAGLAFAAIENLLYLNVYIPHAHGGIVRWRWTVCVAMHAGCSLVAGLGLVRVWREAWKRRSRPRLSLAYPYLVAAVAIHGSYNAFAVLLQAVHSEF